MYHFTIICVNEILAANIVGLVYIVLCMLLCRGSRSQMFFKIVVLKDFTIFTGKHLC